MGKKIINKARVLTVMALAAIGILAGTAFTWAYDWEWTGWDEDTKDEAWLVFEVTDWDAVGDFIYEEPEH